jgi:hypothetical protein
MFYQKGVPTFAIRDQTTKSPYRSGQGLGVEVLK